MEENGISGRKADLTRGRVSEMDWSGLSVLVTGGTGSFGKKFAEVLLKTQAPKRLIIFSRDELKQQEMRHQFPDDEDSPIRYFIGDVRDKDRLYRAFDGVDVVVHAAALKQVPAAEYNPIEAIKTNVLGAANVIDAAIDLEVTKLIALSTDKAANPVNLYGATKLCSDKLFVAANAYSGRHRTRFAAVRYGNVVGSRGSVIPLFLRLRETGTLPITDPRMTRFWITLDQTAGFVLKCFDRMYGGELFVPKLPSMRVTDVAEAIAPKAKAEVIGVRPGEKMHEVMVPEDDARQTLEFDDYFVIQPAHPYWDSEGYASTHGGRPCADGFRYSSDTNDTWLTVEDLRRMIKEVE